MFLYKQKSCKPIMQRNWKIGPKPGKEKTNKNDINDINWAKLKQK